jgi:hypothetical protein
MHQLSDADLIEAYKIAIELKLEEPFIRLLENELRRRGLCTKRESGMEMGQKK